MNVFAFDRDGTVETGEPRGPIPLLAIRGLQSAPGHACYAIGNQALAAEIGIHEIDAIWRCLGGVPQIAIPTGDTAVAILADPDKMARNIAAKHARLDGISRVHPDAHVKICVDDLDISHPGWIYLTPGQFVSAFGC